MGLLLKIVLVAGATALLLTWLLRGLRRGDDEPSGPSVPPEPPGPAPALASIVACAHCGVHLPQADAIGQGDRFYCSAAHRDAGPSS